MDRGRMADPFQPRPDDAAGDASTGGALHTPAGSPAEACTGSADGGTVWRRRDAVARGRCGGRGERSPGSVRGLVRQVERGDDPGGAPSRVARRDPRAPRLRSSALGGRTPRSVHPVARPRPGRAPCRAARVLRRRGRRWRSRSASRPDLAPGERSNVVTIGKGNVPQERPPPGQGPGEGGRPAVRREKPPFSLG